MYLPGKLTDVLNTEEPIKRTYGFKYICRVAILCNRAVFLSGQSDMEIKYRVVAGDASETAVLKFMETVHGNTSGYRHKYFKVRIKRSFSLLQFFFNVRFARYHSIQQINTKCLFTNVVKLIFW